MILLFFDLSCVQNLVLESVDRVHLLLSTGFFNTFKSMSMLTSLALFMRWGRKECGWFRMRWVFIMSPLLVFIPLVCSSNEFVWLIFYCLPSPTLLDRIYTQQQQYICIHQCLLSVLEGKDMMDSPRSEIHDNQGYEGLFFFFSPTQFTFYFFKLIWQNCLPREAGMKSWKFSRLPFFRFSTEMHLFSFSLL